jgi:hypothetical protein
LVKSHQQKRQALLLVFFAVCDTVTGKSEPIGSREPLKTADAIWIPKKRIDLVVRVRAKIITTVLYKFRVFETYGCNKFHF